MAINATTSPASPAEKKATPKSKEALASDLKMSLSALEAQIIVWVPFVVTPDDNRLLKAVAQARTTDKKSPVKVFMAPSVALAEWLDANREAFTKEAEEHLKDNDLTEDEITKALAKIERDQAKLKAMLAMKKG